MIMSSTKPGSPEFPGQGSPEIDTTVSEESRRKFGGFTLEQGKVRWESETAGIRPTVRELVHSRRCLVTCSIWRQDSSTTVDSGTIAEQKGPRQGQQQAQIGGTLEFKRYRWYLLRDPTRTRKESRRFASCRAHCSIENWLPTPCTLGRFFGPLVAAVNMSPVQRHKPPPHGTLIAVPCILSARESLAMQASWWAKESLGRH